MPDEQYLISFNMIPKGMEKLANFSNNSPFGNSSATKTNSSGAKVAGAIAAIAGRALLGVGRIKKQPKFVNPTFTKPKLEIIDGQQEQNGKKLMDWIKSNSNNEVGTVKNVTLPKEVAKKLPDLKSAGNNLSTVDNNLQSGRFVAQNPKKLNVPNISNKIAFSEKMKMLNINDAEKIKYKPATAQFIKGPKNVALEPNKPYGPFPEKPIFKGVQKDQIIKTQQGAIIETNLKQGQELKYDPGEVKLKHNQDIENYLKQLKEKREKAESIPDTTNSATENRKDERNSPEIDENNPE